MSKKIVVLLFSFIGLLQSCNTTEPPPPPPNGYTIENTITLTTLWQDLNKIALKFTRAHSDTISSFDYSLKRKDPDGSLTEFLYTLTWEDTTIVDNNLTEGTDYSYKVEAIKNNKTVDTSKTLIVTTLDTTSHEIVWEIDTLGQPGNFLNDIWGTDEYNVWAVGYVSLLGDDLGIVKWDGERWNPFPSFDGVKQSIHGFNEQNIFVAGTFGAYGVIGRWDGSIWHVNNFLYDPLGTDTIWALHAVWGTSPDDVWAVGDKGTIVHWDGVEWKKVRSPVNLLLYDIWGTSANNIYAIRISLAQQSQLIHYDGNNWIEITDQLPAGERNFTSLWFDKGGTGYVVGNNVLYYNGGSFNRIEVNQDKFLLRVRGRNSTDVFTVGQKGRVYHFNGIDWITYPELFDETPGMELRGVYVTETTVFAAGIINGGSIIYRGVKQ